MYDLSGKTRQFSSNFLCFMGRRLQPFLRCCWCYEAILFSLCMQSTAYSQPPISLQLHVSEHMSSKYRQEVAAFRAPLSRGKAVNIEALRNCGSCRHIFTNTDKYLSAGSAASRSVLALLKTSSHRTKLWGIDVIVTFIFENEQS